MAKSNFCFRISKLLYLAQLQATDQGTPVEGCHSWGPNRWANSRNSEAPLESSGVLTPKIRIDSPKMYRFPTKPRKLGGLTSGDQSSNISFRGKHWGHLPELRYLSRRLRIEGASNSVFHRTKRQQLRFSLSQYFNSISMYLTKFIELNSHCSPFIH